MCRKMSLLYFISTQGKLLPMGSMRNVNHCQRPIPTAHLRNCSSWSNMRKLTTAKNTALIFWRVKAMTIDSVFPSKTQLPPRCLQLAGSIRQRLRVSMMFRQPHVQNPRVLSKRFERIPEEGDGVLHVVSRHSKLDIEADMINASNGEDGIIHWLDVIDFHSSHALQAGQVYLVLRLSGLKPVESLRPAVQTS